jgi:hypothetical protein
MNTPTLPAAPLPRSGQQRAYWRLPVNPTAAALAIIERARTHDESVATVEEVSTSRRNGDTHGAYDRVGAPGGRVVVLDAGTSGLRVFDTTGAVLRRFSAKGAGPGEYRLVSGLGAIGDSIWMLDATLRRSTLFAPDGRVLVTSPWIALPTGAARDAAIAPRGLFTDRSQWGWPEGFSLSDSLPRTERQVARLAIDARVLSDMGMVTAGHDWFAVPNADGGFVLMKQSFPDQPLGLTSAREPRLVVVDRAARRGAKGKARIVAFSSDGRTLWERQMAVDARPIPKRVLDSVWTRHLKGVRGVPNGEQRLRERLFLPSTYPLIRSAFLSHSDELWLQLDERAGAEQWVVLDRDGRTVGRVPVPSGVTLQAGSGGVVWGTRLGPDDVPMLVAYEVVRR